MLVFNPKKRISVSEALAHPLFKEIRSLSNERVAESRVVLPFNDWKPMDQNELRFAFLSEIQKFHPEVEIPEHLKAAGYGSSA